MQPPNGGYWVDGVDDNIDGEDAEPRVQPGTPRQASRRTNIDTDDTANYYRRFFFGKVRKVYNVGLFKHMEICLRIACYLLLTKFVYSAKNLYYPVMSAPFFFMNDGEALGLQLTRLFFF